MGEEKPLVERFSQEIRRIFLGWNERDTKLESLDHIADKEVAPLDVFHFSSSQGNQKRHSPSDTHLAREVEPCPLLLIHACSGAVF